MPIAGVVTSDLVVDHLSGHVSVARTCACNLKVLKLAVFAVSLFMRDWVSNLSLVTILSRQSNLREAQGKGRSSLAAAAKRTYYKACEFVLCVLEALIPATDRN